VVAAVTNSNKKEKTKAQNETFSGNIVELLTDKLTVSRNSVLMSSDRVGTQWPPLCGDQTIGPW